MRDGISRRGFLKTTAGLAAATAAGPLMGGQARAAQRAYGISLAGWSLHRTIGEGEGKTPMLEMPRLAREEFGIEAIELVNRMLASTDKAYVDQFIKNAADHDVKILLIMIDGAGSVGTPSERGREKAVEMHREWIDVAADMGCHCVRMNWSGYSDEVFESAEAMDAYIDRSVAPFRAICDHGDKRGLDVVIENHWGPSSYPDALLKLIEKVDHERFGTLPDFGNFPEEIDIYDAVDRMMPYARAVSAKCYDFNDETGRETKLDYERLISIVADKHGYDGYIGIEYEGNRLSEFDGIKACKRLLESLRD
jgi:sugar phosphate isomerase/epimerase